MKRRTGGEMYHLKHMITSLHKGDDFKKEKDKIASGKKKKSQYSLSFIAGVN